MATRPSRAAKTNALKAIDAHPVEDNEDNKDDEYQHDEDKEEEDKEEDSEYDSDASNDSYYVERRVKSEQEKDAEGAACMALDMTLKDLYELRKGIKTIYKLFVAPVWGPSGDLRGFFQRLCDSLMTATSLSEEEKANLVGVASRLSQDIDLPEQEIANAFAPLHEYNGGIFTKLSMHMRDMFTAAILVDMVEQWLKVPAEGTAQAKGFEFILSGMLHLDMDMARTMSMQVCTESPLESVTTSAKELVHRINQLPPKDRLTCLMRELTMVPCTVATTFPELKTTKQGFCTAMYDHRRTKREHEIAINDCNVKLTVSIGSLPQSPVHKAVESKCPELRNAKFCTFSSGSDLDFDVLLRASTTVYNPSPTNMYDAFKHLLGTKEKAPKMHDILSAAYPDKKEKMKVLNLPRGCLLLVEYQTTSSKRISRLGLEAPTKRNMWSPYQNEEALSQRARRWLYVPGKIMNAELKALLFPPWIAYDFGVVSVVIVPPQENPDMDDFIHHHALNFGLRKSRHHADELCLQMKTLKRQLLNGKRRELTAEENAEVEATAIENCRPALHGAFVPTYASSLYPEWSDKGPIAKMLRNASNESQRRHLGAELATAKRKRAEDIDRGKMAKKARKAVEEERRLRPGGDLFKEAEAHFEQVQQE